MTLKVYTSVLDSEIDEAGEKLSIFIGRDGNKTVERKVTQLSPG
jgi:hypothetical protein